MTAATSAAERIFPATLTDTTVGDCSGDGGPRSPWTVTVVLTVNISSPLISIWKERIRCTLSIADAIFSTVTGTLKITSLLGSEVFLRAACTWDKNIYVHLGEKAKELHRMCKTIQQEQYNNNISRSSNIKINSSSNIKINRSRSSRSRKAAAAAAAANNNYNYYYYYYYNSNHNHNHNNKSALIAAKAAATTTTVTTATKKQQH